MGLTLEHSQATQTPHLKAASLLVQGLKSNLWPNLQEGKTRETEEWENKKQEEHNMADLSLTISLTLNTLF